MHFHGHRISEIAYSAICGWLIDVALDQDYILGNACYSCSILKAFR